MKACFFEERGIYYRMNERDPSRPTLLFIHGLSGSSSAWLPYERAMEGRYNIISPDLRGHGKSRKLLFYSAYTPELIGDDIVALLTHLRVAHCIVIGHSFGTLLALAALKQDPAKFSAMVMINPTYGASRAWWLPFARVLFVLFHTFSFLLPFDPNPRGHVDYEKLVPTWDWSPSRIIPDVRNTSLRVYIFCVQHIYENDTSSWWMGLRIPTLIIHGRRDTVIPTVYAEALHRLLQHSELVLLDNADHTLPLNFPEKTQTLIERFVERNAKGA